MYSLIPVVRCRTGLIPVVRCRTRAQSCIVQYEKTHPLHTIRPTEINVRESNIDVAIHLVYIFCLVNSRVLIVSSLHHTITLVFAGKAKTSCYYLYNLLLYSCAPFPYQCLLTTCNRVLFCRCDVLNQAYLKCTRMHCLYHYTNSLDC